MVILKPDENDYGNAHPTSEDALAIIEVSDSSYQYDANEKMSLYASANVPVYLIVDLNNSQLIQYREPNKDHYKMTDYVDTLEIPSIDVKINKQELF